MGMSRQSPLDLKQQKIALKLTILTGESAKVVLKLIGELKNKNNLLRFRGVE